MSRFNFYFATIGMLLNFCAYGAEGADDAKVVPNSPASKAEKTPIKKLPQPSLSKKSLLPQASIEDLSLRKKTEPVWASGIGLGFPDYYFVEARYALSKSWNIRAFYTPKIPFYLAVNAPADEEVIKSRLKAGTPATKYQSVVRYTSNWAIQSQHKLFENYGFYFSFGFGFRRIHVIAGGNPDLYVCLVTYEIPCTKETETFPSRSRINLQADIEISAYIARSSLGWRWNWDNGVYVDWAFMGLALPFKRKQSITVNSSLDSEGNIAEAEEILAEMDTYLEQKKASIMGRVVSSVNKFDQMKLPVGSLSFGYRF